jgi:hypothetical protein
MAVARVPQFDRCCFRMLFRDIGSGDPRYRLRKSGMALYRGICPGACPDSGIAEAVESSTRLFSIGRCKSVNLTDYEARVSTFVHTIKDAKLILW